MDIDLLILCKSHVQADALRRSIDPEALALPLHLAFMTFNEAADVDAVRLQQSRPIWPAGCELESALLNDAASKR